MRSKALSVLPSLAEIRQFLTLTVVPIIAGSLATWLVHLSGALASIGVGSIEQVLSEVLVWIVGAVLAWLTAHHILKGTYNHADLFALHAHDEPALGTAAGVASGTHLLTEDGRAFVKRKCGRLGAFIPDGLKDFTAYTTAVLQAAPAIFKVPATTYPMDNNDVEGDCTIAGWLHLIAAACKLYGGTMPTVTSALIRKVYRGLTGGGDTGLVEADVLKTAQTKGLFGVKIEAYAPVNPRHIAAIKQAIAYYGGCYFGITCPDSMQRQFEEGKPITYVGETGDDGHCIVGLGFDENYVYCATWGKVVPVSYGFFAKCLQEGWVVITSQLAAAKKDTLGVNITALKADLPSV